MSLGVGRLPDAGLHRGEPARAPGEAVSNKLDPEIESTPVSKVQPDEERLALST